MGAMIDQGITIQTQEPGAGVIRGNRGGINITAMLQTLADGSIQVRFDQSGATSTDPGQSIACPKVTSGAWAVEGIQRTRECGPSV